MHYASYHIKRYFKAFDSTKEGCSYHPSVPCFWTRQVSHNCSAEADVALTNAPNYSKQKEHAEAPGNSPDCIGGHQAKLKHKAPS